MSVFHLSRHPFSRWPTGVHIGLALAFLFLVVGLSHVWQERVHHQLAVLETDLATLRAHSNLNRIAEVQAPAAASPDFTHSLPSRALADEVVRDMGRQSQALGISLGALTLVHQLPNAREWGKVQLTVTTVGEYAKAKGWLAELLARYPSLAVQTLSIRAGVADAARQEWQLVLALYAKD
jgi:hypothetical protein